MKINYRKVQFYRSDVEYLQQRGICRAEFVRNVMHERVDRGVTREDLVGIPRLPGEKKTNPYEIAFFEEDLAILDELIPRAYGGAVFRAFIRHCLHERVVYLKERETRRMISDNVTLLQYLR